MDVIESCNSNTHTLLDAALAHSTPNLAILAASTFDEEQHQTLFQSLRVYLLACLGIKDQSDEMSSIIDIMGMVVEEKCLVLLEDGLKMVFPVSILSNLAVD